jgi:hypothetical protein
MGLVEAELDHAIVESISPHAMVATGIDTEGFRTSQSCHKRGDRRLERGNSLSFETHRGLKEFLLQRNFLIAYLLTYLLN